ncbi:MAG: dihydropteroate synthase [Gammaproteobacteria bacterium]|jgi:dihydropteroate synthase|nr:dihydropteroate synthase [Gammaproteobacteria bacterium]
MSSTVVRLKIMGIVNVTPDSFYDGGRYYERDQAISHAMQLIREGADIIDIGGESTRPGAKPVSIDEECDRVIPIIEYLSKETATPISIDSRHTAVMKAALHAGAQIVNDVSGMQDATARELVAKHQVPVCIMHMQGKPETMQHAPIYTDIIQEVLLFLKNRIELCEKAGILRENIWIDPGFGFGKTLEHNLTLLSNLSSFKQLGCEILVGLSRKSMFGKLLNKPEEQRLHGSIAGTVVACLQGATIIRTHDVSATKDALAVVDALHMNSHRSTVADVSTA